MAINFPNAPYIGDIVNINDIQYRWDGNYWNTHTNSVVNVVKQSNNGAIDLSLGNYHKILFDSSTLNSSVSFSNIPSGSSKWTVEISSIGSDFSSIANASYDNVVFIENQDGFSNGMAFNSTGTRLYFVGNSTDKFLLYTLSTPYDFSTAYYNSVSTITATAQNGNPFDLIISKNNTSLYMLGATGNTLYRYSMPYQLVTTGFAYANDTLVFTGYTATGVYINSDGTRIYMVSSSPAVVVSYTLSNPYVLNSAVFDNISFDYSAQFASAGSLTFSTSGDKMFVSSLTDVYQYTLSTPFEVNTATYDNISFQLFSNSFHIEMNNTGTKLYTIYNSIIRQYSTSSAFVPAITWSNSIIWDNDNPPSSLLKNNNIICEFYSPDGGTTVYGTTRFIISN